MNSHRTRSGRDYLQRCKRSTPEQKLAWLAAALEFAQARRQRSRPARTH